MPPTVDNTLRGITLMVASMACFAIGDTFLKLTAGALSPAHTTLLLIGGALIVFVALAWTQGEPLLDRTALAPVLLLRYAAEAITAVSLVLAYAHAPYSTVGAILQANPLMVALGAVLFLGETISRDRWVVIALGFVGVLLILQPGSEGFNAATLWAVVAITGMSARDLLTRLTPPGMSSLRVAAYTMIAITPCLLTWVLLSEDHLIPPDTPWGPVLAMIGFSALAYLLLTASVRAAPASVITPFRYSRLIFLLVLGGVVFDERPSASMLFGAALILICGLAMMWRDRRPRAPAP